VGKEREKWKCSKCLTERERDTARLSGVVGVCVMKEKSDVPRTQLKTIKSSEFSPLLLEGCSS